MANNPQSRKRARQTIARTERNKPVRTRAAHTVRAAQSALDRAARRNVIHPNAAARRKGRLAAQLKAHALAA